MFELIVFTYKISTEGALENSSPVGPDIPLALYAHCICEGTNTGVCLQTLPAMADETLAEVTDGTDLEHKYENYISLTFHNSSYDSKQSKR